MLDSSALPSPSSSPERTPSAPHPPTASSAAVSSELEIIAPDRFCAELLLRDASRLFSAALAPGPAWVIRVQPPAGAEGVLEVLALVVHWLDSIPLPCTKVIYGERSYLIRARNVAGLGASTGSAFTTASEAVH